MRILKRDILNKSQLNIKTIDRYDQDVIPTYKLHAILVAQSGITGNEWKMRRLDSLTFMFK